MIFQQVRIGDLFTLQRRAVSVDPESTYSEIGVRSFGRGLFHKEAVTGEEIGRKRIFKILPGDLVVSNIFAWEGALAIAGEAETGRVGSHRFMTWTTADSVTARYVRHYLLSSSGLQKLRSASPGSAGRNRTLGVSAFQNLQIPIPSPSERRRIADTLDAIEIYTFEAIGKIRKQFDVSLLLPALTSQVLHSARLPHVRAKELFSTVSDIVHPGDDPKPADRFVGLEHIEAHTGRRLGHEPLGTQTGRKLRFREAQVLYGYLRPYQNKVWVADGPGLSSVEQYVLNPSPGTDPHLLAHALRSGETLEQVKTLTHHLQLPRIRLGLLGNVTVPDVRLAPSDLRSQLEGHSTKVQLLLDLFRLQATQAGAILPAARNQEFREPAAEERGT